MCLNETVDQVRSQDFLMNEVVISSRRHISRENKTEDLELPLMEFEAVAMATNYFSNANKLGQGGFGIVYKVQMIEDFLFFQILSLDKISLCNEMCVSRDGYLMGKKSQ